MHERTYFRAMRRGTDGRPICGATGARLGVRPVDIETDDLGQVCPGRGGLSVTPDDPGRLPVEFRPEVLGGLGRLPVFSIRASQLGDSLGVRPDPRYPEQHAFVEPSLEMPFDRYQTELCETAPGWEEYS